MSNRKTGRAIKTGKPVQTSTHDWEYFARCASGFEKALARELKELGLQRVRPLQGGVSFFGSLHDGYVACLWSSIATRIQVVLVRVGAKDADTLYHDTTHFAWEKHVPKNATVAVEAHGTNKNLRNTKFTALKIKDGLCDHLRQVRGARPNVDAKNPSFSVNVALHEQRATLYLNLSGESLHRRGYRKDGEQSEAPLKETLAAGMLLVAGWPQVAKDGATFVDPMCGSGTLAIEAALMASHTAPGLLRSRWGFMGWKLHDPSVWQGVLDEARSARIHRERHPPVLASDIDEGVVRMARANASRASVEDWIRFEVGDARDLKRRLRGPWATTSGLLATNPPYGVRLLSPTSLKDTYASLATAVEALPTGWCVAIITPDAGIDSSLGRLPESTVSCYNGPLPAWIRLYSTREPRFAHKVTSLTGTHLEVPLAEQNSVQFASRLRKMARERARWARKEDISCYRVYDADLPDYAISIDLYQAEPSSTENYYALLVEYARPRKTDPQRAARRLADAAALTAALLGINPNSVIMRPWSDARDTSRSKHTSQESVRVRVSEDGILFNVNLLQPNKTLPLGQRSLRRHVAQTAVHKSVAALFAPSASMVAHAALGGAASIALADASSKQLSFAKRVLRGTPCDNKDTDFVCVDPRRWARQCVKAHRSYDLILCAPPEWLHPSEAGGNEWDLARDHVALLQDAAGALAPGGALLFACAYPQASLRMDELCAAGLHVEDVSAQMVPHDFEHSRHSTRVYVLQNGT